MVFIIYFTGILFSLFLLAINIYIYRIRFILNKHKLKKNIILPSITDFSDITNFKNLITSIKDEELKKKYKKIHKEFKLFVLLFIVSVSIFFSLLIVVGPNEVFDLKPRG